MTANINGPANLVILNHGGGIQTSAIVQMIAEGLLQRPHAAIFSDTGNEPGYVYEQVEWAKGVLAGAGVPLLVVDNGNILEDVYSGGRFAAMPLFTRLLNGSRGKRQKVHGKQSAIFDVALYDEPDPTHINGFGLEAQLEQKGKMKRQCTNEYKIVPINRELRIMLLEMGLAKETKDKKIRVGSNVIVESWIGYTVDEAERMKPSRFKWQRMRYPLIEMRMSFGDVVHWLSERGLSFFSSNCSICPLISDRRVMEMRIHAPKDYAARVKFDEDLRNGVLDLQARMKGELFVHNSCLPLREVELDANRPKPLIGCVGYCGT